MFKFIHAKTASDIVDPSTTLGIEITDKTVAVHCGHGNIDGQHGYGHNIAIGRVFPTSTAPIFVTDYLATSRDWNGRAAIDIATEHMVDPREIKTFATSRPDVDAIGAMAVLVLRSLGLSNAINRDLVATIAKADSFRPGGDWAPRPLPTEENPWPTGANSVDSTEGIAHLGMICSPRRGDFTESLSLAERVAVIAELLIYRHNGSSVDSDYQTAIRRACGAEPHNRPQWAQIVSDRARDEVLRSRKALAKSARERGAVQVCLGDTIVDAFPREDIVDILRQLGGNTFAVVRVAHAGALGLGYCVAPVVVAFDQATPGKVTIAAYDVRYLDRAGLLRELNYAETTAGGSPSWGGPPTMCSSPQNGGTRLAEETIIETVAVFVRA